MRAVHASIHPALEVEADGFVPVGRNRRACWCVDDKGSRTQQAIPGAPHGDLELFHKLMRKRAAHMLLSVSCSNECIESSTLRQNTGALLCEMCASHMLLIVQQV
eukprot:557297-Pelagomonas_calceolata.AAC.3